MSVSTYLINFLIFSVSVYFFSDFKSCFESLVTSGSFPPKKDRTELFLQDLNCQVFILKKVFEFFVVAFCAEALLGRTSERSFVLLRFFAENVLRIILFRKKETKIGNLDFSAKIVQK